MRFKELFETRHGPSSDEQIEVLSKIDQEISATVDQIVKDLDGVDSHRTLSSQEIIDQAVTLAALQDLANSVDADGALTPIRNERALLEKATAHAVKMALGSLRTLRSKLK